SSRRRHTRFSRAWSSDVCSSDLVRTAAAFAASVPLSIHACAWRVITFMVRSPYVNRRYMWLTLGGTPGNTIRNVIAHPPSRAPERGRASGRERVESAAVADGPDI